MDDRTFFTTTGMGRIRMVTKGIVYYTDNRCEERIADVCRKQILKVTDMPIVSVSQYPIDFGTNIVMDLPRCSASMFRQILEGIINMKTDYIFLLEHDVLYDPSHFDFTPPDNRFWYNSNRWQVCWRTGKALYRKTRCTSLCVAERTTMLIHFTALVKLIDAGGYSRKKHGFAPGTHKIDGVPEFGRQHFASARPCVDIRHGTNFTPTKWRKDEFTDQRAVGGWTESDTVPYWGKTEDRFDEFLREVYNGKV
jgi:hypothetical protein